MNTSKPITKTYVNKAGNAVSTGYKTTKNTLSMGYARFRGMSTFVQVLIGFIILILLIILIIFIKNLYDQAQYRNRQSPFIVTTPINAFRKNSDRPVRSVRVPDPIDGLNFTYSMWIYIADWNFNFGSWKNILLKGDSTGDIQSRAPGIWLYPKTNSLHARINTHADYNEGCDIRNIPLQKWVHIVYVLNNRTVDIYIDGKLERSCVLRGVPILNRNPVHIAAGGGFYGQIAKMQYFTRALQPNDIAQIYSEGPYMSSGIQIWGSNGNGNGGNNNNCPNEEDD
jgi:hypothetical protein